MAFIISVSLLVPAVMVGPASVPDKVASAGLQPSLAQIVKETPDVMVRVIVKRADDSDRAERFTETLGGQVIKEPNFINGFVAEVPAVKIAKFEKDPRSLGSLWTRRW